MRLTNLKTRLGTVAGILLAASAFGCSDSSSSDGSGGQGGSGNTGNTGGTGMGGSGNTGNTGGTGMGGSGGTASGDCDVTFNPTDSQDDIKTALNDDVMSGDTICFNAGTYSFTDQLNMPNLPNLTMRGTGATREDTILDFANQTTGDNGVFMDAGESFTIENLWVKNTPGDGVEVKADNVVFRNIRVSWDRGPSTENGAYAIYPVEADNILVEDCEASDAADAAIYVGQGDNAIVRNNDIHDNVLGIEIENTRGSEVYGNRTYNNTTGIALFVLSGLEQKVAERHLVYDNVIEDNNLANFAPPGAIIELLPRGTGLIILGADDSEIRNNTFRNNSGAAILIVSHELVDAINPGGYGEPETDGFPENTFIHGNTYENNGTMPQDSYPLLVSGVSPLPNVIWDGAEAGMGMAGICLGMSPTTFYNFRGGVMTPDDVTSHTCDGATQPTVSF